MSRTRWLLGGLAVVAAGGVTLACLRFAERDAVARLEPIKAKVRADFPEVARISTAELHRRLHGPAGPDPASSPGVSESKAVLLDVRREEEFAVSHLEGAIRVDPGLDPAEVPDLLPSHVDRDTPLVLYCSVGYRSARLARALAASGFRRVENLEGSIFEWVAEGYPLVDGRGPVDHVHPYGRAWAWLVDPEHRAYEPRDPRPGGPRPGHATAAREPGPG